jgi:hypothetical protein
VIKNRVERCVTARALAKFRDALAQFDANGGSRQAGAHAHERAAMEAQAADLEAEIREYDARFVRQVVYVAGPISKGPLLNHTRAAFAAASELVDAGFSVTLPHAFITFEIAHPKDYDVMMSVCRPHVVRADALLRLPGESDGADREVAWADAADVPVFHTVAELIEAADYGIRTGRAHIPRGRVVRDRL